MIMIISLNAQFTSPNHAPLDIPRLPSTLFRIPIFGSKISVAKKDTMVVLITYGKNVINFKYLWNGIFIKNIYAIKYWKGVMINQTQRRYLILFFNALKNSGVKRLSPNIVLKLSSPIK